MANDLFVILIVFLAGAFIIRIFYRKIKNQERQACECSACDLDTKCSEPEKNISQDP